MDVERRSRSTCLSKMSTVSLDSGHVVVELGDSLGYEARLVQAIFNIYVGTIKSIICLAFYKRSQFGEVL